MIRQHFLQQQRLSDNHERLLQRFNRISSPQISQFPAFGTSSLPGRNYDQHLNTINRNSRRRESLIAQSRANIGPSSDDTYRWMGNGASSEHLPRNINSVMQHTRQQSLPLVHAERFEPVQVYEHPVFGPTPAYLRPVYNGTQQAQINDGDDLDDDDEEVKSHNSLKIEPKTTPSVTKDDNVENSTYIPKGYMSYKNWKAKYENLIPVNPLLYTIYTQRTNGSVDSYGRALYASSNHFRQVDRDEDVFTPTSSDTASISSELPRENASSSSRRYNRLQPQSYPSINTLRPANQNESSDDESSPSDSPVPYLSRNTPNRLISTNVPSTITPAPMSTTINNRDSSLPLLTTTSTSTIPPAPPMPSSMIPPAPPMPSSSIPSAPPMPSSSIPPAPPMPASLLPSSSSTITYQTPSNLPLARPVPTALSTTSSNALYQTPSSIVPPSTSSVAGSTGKAVTFGGSTSVPVSINDISSSSDSDDDEKTKRRRRRKKQIAAGLINPNDASSSDD